ncbi:MAG TPA: protein-disulfide reductase DsbD domain-containing protein [Alphaproteobacteria bacterium]|nr:protein-disulfide reductase DsbD domain-containing protein [Alphaproteobacteria bacterium]
MTRLILLLLLCATAITNAFAAPGQTEWVSTDAIHSQLVASNTSVRAGQTFGVAWHIKTEPKWHVYWSNPGDSGLPPTINPGEGFKAGPLTFPTPKLISTPPVTNYGYEHEVILTAQVTAPATLPAGKTTLPVALTYLYCSDEVCMPGRINTSLELESTLGEPQANPAYADLQKTQAPTLPQQLPAGANLAASLSGNTFSLTFSPAAFGKVESVRFLPAEDGMIQDSGPQTYANGTLTFSTDPQSTTPPTTLRGLLVVNGSGYVIEKLPLTAPVATAPAGAAPATTGVGGLFFALLSAFIAGLILNLMPCVMPVLALKAFALLKGHENRAASIRHATGYTLGVVGTFLVLGGLTLALQQAGHGIGWGFQLQQPLFVAGLCALMLTLALSFFGVIEVGSSLTRLGHTGRSQHFTNDIATGILAVVVATPCTVPFMGGAVAFALTQHPAVSLAVFAALGLGLAAPLVAITLLPGLGRLLPKPGAWLASFKQLLGWPLLATALWLLWVYHNQTDALHFFTLLAALLAFSFGLWLYGRRPQLWRLALLAVLGIGGAYAVTMPPMPTANWQEWSETEVNALRPHRPVFVDFTADWCLSCKVNEATVLNTTRTQALFAQKNVALFKADWTMQNADISAELAKHGRRGVPLYLLYVPGKDAQILPQILTYGEIEKAFN